MSVYASPSSAPATPSGNLGIRHVLRMRPRVVSAAHRSLRQDKVLVLGEVLTARAHGRAIYLLLRDAENDGNVLQAVLPSSIKLPPVGGMVAVHGRLVVSRSTGEDGAMQIQVEEGFAHRHSHLPRGRLFHERREVAQLSRALVT